MSESRYLLVKRGLFYGPNNQGYTGVKERAGRYPESDARPADGVTAIHEDEAPMFAPACWHEVKAEYLLGKIEEVQSERDKYKAALRAIQFAVEDGRVCDDVAWFSKIETLYDYIDGVLSPDPVIADLFAEKAA